MPRFLTLPRRPAFGSTESLASPAVSGAEEQRRLARSLITPEMGFSVRVLDTFGIEMTAELVDMHSLGIGVALPSDAFDGKALRDGIARVEIRFGSQLIIGLDLPEIKRIDAAAGVVGLSFDQTQGQSGNPVRQLRTGERVRSREAFLPIAFCADPFKVAARLHLRVKDLSSGGFRLETSLTNRHLIPGVELDLQLVLPGIGFTGVRTRLRNADVHEGRLLVGVSFVQPSKEFLTKLGNFSVFGAESSSSSSDVASALSALGLTPKQVAAGYLIRAVNDLEEYGRVLDVRLEAYRAASKVPTTAVAQDMADDYDRRALILFAGAQRKTVATARLVRCPLEGDRFQFEGWFPRVVVRDRLRSCEISKLAIATSHQGTDLVLSLFQSCYESVLKGGIDDVYCVATRALEPLYIRLGAKRLGSGYPHPTLAGETMSLFVMNAEVMTRAGQMTVHCWEAVARDVAFQLSAVGFAKRPTNHVQRFIRKQLEKLVLAFNRYQSRKKRRRSDS